MKKALRIILPIILVLAILASAVWYLLEYDPEFTRDSIMATARGFDSMGEHKLAAWLYDLAYRQTQGGDDVAIELANHYKSHGNYTKAEYTLSSAIADGGTLELYLALCQTYVEQDKILDAVNMLANIKDASIKEQIDAMRPAAPTFTPDPGFYSQYVSVSAMGEENAAIYVSFNGEYPSTQENLYTESVKIPEGETTVYGVCINDLNLVSELTIQGYTIGGIIETVEFKDEVLEQHIRQLTNFSSTRPFQTNDLWDVTELTIPEGVKSLEDLIHFPYLEKLTLENIAAMEVTVLSNLTKIKHLSITNAQLSLDSLKAIGTLKNLETLTLANCGLSTISHLENLTQITKLDLTGNTLRNINVFSGYTMLKELYMSNNALTDLDALSGLKELTLLDISHNSVQSVTPICGLTGLKTFLAGNNAISKVEGIGTMIGLEKVDLSQNNLLDPAPLAACTNLQELILSNNLIKDISSLSAILGLLRLDVSHNEISELPKFTKENQLGYLNISYNKLKDIKALSVLPKIYSVDIDYNEEVASLEPLIDAHHIIQINCYGTKIAKNPFGTDSGVVVNLDPSLYYNE